MGLDVDIVEIQVIEIVEVSEITTSVTEAVQVVGTVIEVTTESEVTCETVQTVFVEVEVGIPGPQGPPGSSGDEEMKYSERVDFVGEDAMYKGEAVPGSSESAAVWRICKTSFIGDDVIKQWGGGNSGFIHAWADRLTLSYS